MEKKYLTVTALTNYIKHKLDNDPHLRNVFVKGEISNFYLHRMSGHMYLTLKDEVTQIRAIMYRSDNAQLAFTPETGMNVFVEGYISVYKTNGQYQLYIRQMEPSGIGALHLAYEQLKKKLQASNYFAEKYKKNIPLYPNKIAVITSREGAAVQDIITTVKKRYPIVQIVILPVNVQGEQSVPAIIQAIEQANRLDFDTIIVARGGGSIEDLASFNDEQVAMAIFHPNIPVITGIGHETDTTISDLVADLRAPTPTGAAQLAVPSLAEIKRTIVYFYNELNYRLNVQLIQKKERLKLLEQSKSFMYPLQIVQEKEQRIDQLTDQLLRNITEQKFKKEKQLIHLQKQLDTYHPNELINVSIQKIVTLNKQLHYLLRESLKQKRHRLTILIEKLTLLNPLEIMKRGYTITYSEQKQIIKSVKQLSIDDNIRVKLFDGSAICQVKEVQNDKNE